MTLDPATLPDPIALRTADDITLEAEMLVPDAARFCAVVAHPHPQQGGTMRVPFIDLLFHALPQYDIAAIRFNFRGAGGSGGEHDGGLGERLDLEAAMDAIAERAPGLPLWLTGWSFGADIGLSVTRHEVAGWVAVAPPLMTVRSEAAPLSRQRKVILSPENDQFRSAADAAKFTAEWTNTTVESIPGTDHFLAGQMENIVQRVAETITGVKGAA